MERDTNENKVPGRGVTKRWMWNDVTSISSILALYYQMSFGFAFTFKTILATHNESSR